jgi:toxin ParE1/3/4
LSAYRLGKKATDDLNAIFEYTVESWSVEQAVLYLDALNQSFQLITSSPGMGRSCNQVYPGAQRMESGSHVIFFKKETRGILIARILHKKMMPSKDHFLDS